MNEWHKNLTASEVWFFAANLKMKIKPKDMSFKGTMLEKKQLEMARRVREQNMWTDEDFRVSVGENCRMQKKKP